MAPPSLPFAVCRGDHDLTRVESARLNLVAAEAALAEPKSIPIPALHVEPDVQQDVRDRQAITLRVD